MGFKKLTVENFDQRDEANNAFGRLDLTIGKVVPVTRHDRARAFLSVELGEHVPQEVRDLFAVARGTMLYGEFFYPMYTLGDEQMHRVTDAAAHHRYLQLGGELESGNVPSFYGRIKRLIGKGAIPEEEQTRWDAYRQLRNIASYADFQQLHAPGDAYTSCKLVAMSVNDLFRRPSSHGDDALEPQERPGSPS